MFAYALKDNMALGGRFKYGRTLVRMDETQLNLDDETSFDINNIYQLKHSYSAMAIFRNYIPLGIASVLRCLARHSWKSVEVSRRSRMEKVKRLPVLIPSRQILGLEFLREW